ncbi:hypothetical protein CRUP_006539 [Coryphaenoides rupestris]|nr:hypothetical protein CRUP_006539 [Coryphaenoides rupestris]
MFATENRSSIKFLAVGDWGGVPYPPYITPVEKATAQEMGRIAAQMGADFVLALGDNFYYTGVDSVDSPRFKDTFESVYTAKSLNIPWYVLAGNHDHAGNLNFRIPNTDKTLSIIMLDTVMLCGNCDDFEDEKPRGPLRAVDANRQLTWLQSRMKQSTADFLLVAGHYPVWSVSEHGPTECLLQRLHPLLYIEESGVGYVVSGAGNFLDPDIRHWHHVPKDAIKFFTGQASTLGGFVHGEVTKDKMILTFFQAKGTSLYRTVLPRRGLD